MNKKKASFGVFIGDSSPWPKGQERAGSFRFCLHLLKSLYIDFFFFWEKEKWKSKLLSCVLLFVTPWNVQSMKFSRPAYWSGCPFPPPGDLPNLGIEPRSPTLQVDSLPTELYGKRRKMLPGAMAIICQSDALKVKNSLENPISSCQVGSCSKLCLLNHLGNWQNFSLLPKVFSIM